jgi:hypothetical protein
MKVKVRQRFVQKFGVVWGWAIFANNGTEMASSQGGYSREGNAVRAAAKFVNACKQGNIQLEKKK